MKTALKIIVALIVLAGAGAAVVWANRVNKEEHEKEKENEKPVEGEKHVAAHDGETVITLNAETQKKIGLAVAALEAREHQEEQQAFGSVLDLQDLVDARAGFTAAQAQLEKARASLEVSRKDYDRLKKLHESGRFVTDKEFEQAEGAKRQDEVALQAAQDAIAAMESSLKQRWGAAVGGWVIGGSIPKTSLVQITLMCGCEISAAPETAFIKSGKSLLPAGLVSAAPRTDARLQGPSFFYQAEGLLPGMSVQAYLPAGEKHDGVLVPSAAVVWWQGKPWVYVQKDDDHFTRREVPPQSPLPEGWFAAEGFKAGEKVVVSGAQVLLSEEFKSQIKEDE
jgi:multidrug efflux pump subunit AcrA (membrane-fusion protein)